jgi:hypothetical protein
MKNHLKTIILFLGISSNLYSQEKKPFRISNYSIAVQTGYACMGKNYVYLGFDKRLDTNEDNFVNVGVGSYISRCGGKTQFIPEIHTNANLGILLLMAELSATTKAVNPSLGLNIVNKLMLKSGYNFGYSKEDFRGITLGVNFNFGTKGYHYLKPMKFM